MESNSSRRMVDFVDEDSRSTTASEDDTGPEADYADIFQRLVNRFIDGQMYTQQKGCFGSRPPKIKHKPCTSILEESEFYFRTKQACGFMKRKPDYPGNHITTMLLNREKGLSTYNNFSYPNKCRISNWFLPNEVKLLDTYEGKVFCGTFSRDGNYFITASQDQQIRLYKTNNGAYSLFKTIHARDVGWSIIDVAFSPDQEHFVYSTWSNSLHLCSVNGDPDKQEPLSLINTSRRFCIFSVAFSSDGSEILGGSNEGYLYVYDRNINRRTLKISAHEYDINSVAFADDSSHIIYSGGDDGLLKVWDRRTLEDCGVPKPVGVLAGHIDGITYVHPRGDGRHLISNSKDQSIKLWDVRVFSSDYAAKNTLKAVHAQSWDYRWQGVPKNMYTKQKLDGDTSIMTYRGHIVTRTLIRARFSPVETTGQRFIYTGCGGGRLVIYDALTGKIKRDARRHSNCVRDVSWHPYRNEILTSSWDGTIGQWYYAYKETAHEKKSQINSKSRDSVRRSLRLALKNRQEIRRDGTEQTYTNLVKRVK